MTLDQIMEEWRVDAPVDSTELGGASLKIPELHSKYLKIYFDERRKLKACEFQSKELSLKKYEYYNCKMSQEELDEMIQHIKDMAKSGELFEKSTAVILEDIEDLIDETDPLEIEQIVNEMLTPRNLQ